jgi:hypothetical protein
MGKRPAEFESFVGNTGSIQREDAAFYAKKRSASRGNGTRTNSSKSQEGTKAGVLEDGVVHPSNEGTPQGGSISVLLSNLYLHYVLDLWFERSVKSRLRGEAYLVRYIDDFVLCFQYRSDALRVQQALRKRLMKFSLSLEPTKTRLMVLLETSEHCSECIGLLSVIGVEC